MSIAANISLLPTPGVVPVAFDLSFLVIATLGAFIVVPLTGAIFLGMWCRIMNVPVPVYRRRYLAYAGGYAAALIVATLMMVLVKDASRVPGWFLASLFVQALAVHAVVVPLVLKTPWGKAIAAQALTLILYGAVLVMAIAPVILHVRRTVDRAEWKADLQNLYQAVTSGKGMEIEKLPAALAELESAEGGVPVLPAHQARIEYLGDYMRRSYPTVPQENFIFSMSRIKTMRPGACPLIWQNPRETAGGHLAVCFYDGTVAHLTRSEFEYLLDATLLAVDKIHLPTAETAPATINPEE